MKTLRLISRILTGIVFIFSGFVKGVDPLGSTYKFTDYFNAFHLGFLEPLALPLAILLSSAELVLGISLLLGYRMKVVAWAVLLFMSFFTVLTFILALTNPVTDCGCFGDALILTNWETFFKNIFLMVLVLIIFAGRFNYDPLRDPVIEWGVILLFFVASVFFSVYNYLHLPLLDFRPYAVGVNIEEGMKIPEDAPADVYSTELIYRNKQTGKEKVFSMDNFPRDTTKWKFIDARSELVSKGYEPPIHNFNIVAPDGNDITSAILDDPGFTFILVSYDLAGADRKALEKANDLFHLSQTLPGLSFYFVTASGEKEQQEIKKENGLDFDFCLADEITLKTVVRSNPGLLLLKDGTIMAKWGSRDIPGQHSFPEYRSVFTGFPLCEGCDLQLIGQPPDGTPPDKFQTVLYYRNTGNDSLAAFTIDNFPRNDDRWVFEKSETHKLPGGYVSPVENLKITSVYGADVTNVALNGNELHFLLFLRSPFSTDPKLLQKLNLLAGMAGDYLNGPYEFFGLSALSGQEIIQFTDQYVTPIAFYHVPEAAMNIAGYKQVLLVMLRDGRVLKVWKDEDLPDASSLAGIRGESLPAAEHVLLPGVLTSYRNTMDKRLVYLFIFGFFSVIFLLRTLLGQPERLRNHD